MTYSELALAHTGAVRNRQAIAEAASYADSALRKLTVDVPTNAISPHVVSVAQLLVNVLRTEGLAADRAEQAASDAARDAFNASAATP